MAPGSRGRDPFRFRAGVRGVVPGWPQGYWGQWERASALLGMYVSALVVVVLAWGTWPGLAMAVLAMGVHGVSIADAIEQSAFPGYGRVVPRCAGLAMVALGYTPLGWLALGLACPMGGGPERGAEGYLVNRWAYGGPVAPQVGDWVCFRRPHDGARCLGRFLAGSNQEVVWRGGAVRVDGRPVPWRTVAMLPQATAGSLRVPEGLAWVESWEGLEPGVRRRCDRLIPLAAIEGRAWMRPWPRWSPRRSFPLWEAS